MTLMNKYYAIRQRMERTIRLPLALGAVLMSVAASAQLNVAAVNTPYTIDFDATVTGISNGAWAGGGFQPVAAAGRLDSDGWAITGFSDGSLAFGGTQITASTDFRRGTTAPGNNPVSAGGIYSFGGAGITGRALGVQPIATDFTPGTITLRVQNNTGSTLTAFDLAYDVYYRNDQDFSNAFNLYWSDNNTSYTYVASQDVISPAAQTGTAWVANARSTTITGVFVPNGQYFYIRWRGDDVSGSGSRDEFALDNISVTGRAYTMVRWTAAASTVNENAGTTAITASIINPDPVIATTVDAVLTSGDATRINNYTTQTLTFPGGSVANQTLTVTVTDNGACDGDAAEVFTLQNIAGGVSPGIGTPTVHTLTVDDDETQAEAYAQFFDSGVGDNWAITAGGANQSTALGAGDTPPNERVLSTTQSWQVINGTVTLDLASISLVDWTGITLSARVSSPSPSTINGNDGGDSVAFYVNLNGAGFPLDPDVRIAGTSNARWGYSTGTGVVSTTAGTPVNVQPAAGGNRTTDGYSTVNITIPDGTSTIALRVIARNNDVAEVWCIDNIQVTGTLCSPVYYSRSNGSEVSATWSTARTGLPAAGAVTFNENATMVVQNGHVVTSTNNTTIALRNLNVETGGTLALAGVSTLEINGPTFDIDGTFTASDDNINLFSDEQTSISGSAGTIDVNNLTLDGAGALVTVNTLKVRGTLQLDNGVFDANNKEVQLISTATGTARLGPVAPTASYSSRLRIERYIPAGVTDWRLLCSPMVGDIVTDWTDDFFTAGFPGSAYPNFLVGGNPWPSVRMYDETDPGPLDIDGLIGVSSVTEPLTVGKGFAAWSGTTLSSTVAFTVDVRGLPTVASTPFSIPLSYTNNGVPAVDGLNLVGNPLPSPVDFTDFTLTNVDNNYYIYDPGSGTNAAWDETTQIGTGGANGHIQSSQGFWLKANAAAPSATLTESAKVLEPINGGIFSDVEANREMVRLFLRDAAATRTDEAVVHFIAGAPAMGELDMVKLTFGNDDSHFISTKATTGEDLVINAFGGLDAPVDVDVKVVVPADGSYVIRLADVTPLLGRACATLEDRSTGNSVVVAEDAELAFDMLTSDPVEPARFVLHIGAPVRTETIHASCATSNNGSIEVTGPGEGPWTFELVLPSNEVITQGPTQDAVTFIGLGAGDHQLHVNGNTGCGTLSRTVRIEAPGLLAGEATAAPATCADAQNGNVDLMTMGGTEPYTYAWSNGAQTEDLTDVPAGEYAVTITDANGCTTTLTSVAVGAGDGPVSSFMTSADVVSTSDTVAFFITGTYGAQYAWDFGDGTGSTENEPFHQYAATGVYAVTLTTTLNGCTAITGQEVVVTDGTAIDERASEGTSAWSEGSAFYVRWNEGVAAGITADVVDATGRTMIQRTAKGGAGLLMIPAQELPTGVYYLRVEGAGGSRAFKLPLVR